MGAQWTTDSQTDQKRSTWTFSGGYDSFVPTVFLTSDKTSEEFGWSSSAHPGLRSDKGLVMLGSSKLTSGVGRGLFAYQTNALIRVRDLLTEAWNPTTNTWDYIPVLPMDGSMNIDATNFEVDGANRLIFVGGDLTTPQYNGGSLDDAPTGAQFITNDTVRLWLAKGDILFFSARLDANDWSSPNNSGFIQVYTPNGGDITGLYRYRGRTIVFKRDYMGEVPGKAYPTSLDDVSTQVGCVSNWTIQEHDGVLYFLGDRQVYRYQGGLPEAIGDPIRSYLDKIGVLNEGYSYSSITRDGEYMLGLMIEPVLGYYIQALYNPKLNIWRIKRSGVNPDHFPNRSIMYRGDQYIMDIRGNVYRVEGSIYNDVSPPQTVTSVAVSPPFSEGLPEGEKEYYELHIQGDIPIGSSVIVMASVEAEGPNYLPVGTIQGSSGSSSTPQIVSLNSIPYSHWFRVRLVATGPVTLYWVELYYNILPVQH